MVSPLLFSRNRKSLQSLSTVTGMSIHLSPNKGFIIPERSNHYSREINLLFPNIYPGIYEINDDSLIFYTKCLAISFFLPTFALTNADRGVCPQ